MAKRPPKGPKTAQSAPCSTQALGLVDDSGLHDFAPFVPESAKHILHRNTASIAELVGFSREIVRATCPSISSSERTRRAPVEVRNQFAAVASALRVVGRRVVAIKSVLVALASAMVTVVSRTVAAGFPTMAAGRALITVDSEMGEPILGVVPMGIANECGRFSDE